MLVRIVKSVAPLCGSAQTPKPRRLYLRPLFGSACHVDATIAPNIGVTTIASDQVHSCEYIHLLIEPGSAAPTRGQIAKLQAKSVPLSGAFGLCHFASELRFQEARPPRMPRSKWKG